MNFSTYEPCQIACLHRQENDIEDNSANRVPLFNAFKYTEVKPEEENDSEEWDDVEIVDKQPAPPAGPPDPEQTSSKDKTVVPEVPIATQTGKDGSHAAQQIRDPVTQLYGSTASQQNGVPPPATEETPLNKSSKGKDRQSSGEMPDTRFHLNRAAEASAGAEKQLQAQEETSPKPGARKGEVGQQISPFKAPSVQQPGKAGKANAKKYGPIEPQQKPEQKLEQKRRARKKIVLPSPPSAKKKDAGKSGLQNPPSGAKDPAKATAAPRKNVERNARAQADARQEPGPGAGGESSKQRPAKPLSQSQGKSSTGSQPKAQTQAEAVSDPARAQQDPKGDAVLLVNSSEEGSPNTAHAEEEAGKAIQPGGKLRAFANPDDLPQTKDTASNVEADSTADGGLPAGGELVGLTPSDKGSSAPQPGEDLSPDISQQAKASRPKGKPSGSGQQELGDLCKSRLESRDPSSEATERLKQPTDQAEQPDPAAGPVRVEDLEKDIDASLVAAERQPSGNLPLPFEAPKPSPRQKRGLQPIPDSTIMDPDPEASTRAQSNAARAAPKRGLRPMPDSTIADPMLPGELSDIACSARP